MPEVVPSVVDPSVVDPVLVAPPSWFPPLWDPEDVEPSLPEPPFWFPPFCFPPVDELPLLDEPPDVEGGGEEGSPGSDSLGVFDGVYDGRSGYWPPLDVPGAEVSGLESSVGVSLGFLVSDCVGDGDLSVVEPPVPLMPQPPIAKTTPATTAITASAATTHNQPRPPRPLPSPSYEPSSGFIGGRIGPCEVSPCCG